MDVDKMKERWAEMDRIRKEALATNRAAMLKKLTEAGITKVEGEYEGYGDSGNSSIAALEPDGKTLSDEGKRDLEALIWDFAYNLNPGFEINEGGNGELSWDIPNDRVDVSHRAVIEQLEEYENV